MTAGQRATGVVASDPDSTSSGWLKIVRLILEYSVGLESICWVRMLRWPESQAASAWEHLDVAHAQPRNYLACPAAEVKTAAATRMETVDEAVAALQTATKNKHIASCIVLLISAHQ